MRDRGTVGLGVEESTAVHRLGAVAARGQSRQLLILEESEMRALPLPTAGALTIGRAADCDLRLVNALVSRSHARLSLNPLAIEDLGSTNGTRLGTHHLEAHRSHSVRLGDPISVGSALLIVRTVEKSGSGARKAVVASSITAAPRVIVEDSTMRALYALVEQVAVGEINVLVLGETGAGKDVVAETIHRLSPRRHSPFVRVNCASLSDALLESELFGHERGAFTGASSGKVGLLEAAQGGTIFLDEVGEMPFALQAKLLHVIETRHVTPVGALRPRQIDVRVVSATNRDPASEVRRGAFRPDLLFRLNGISIVVPPLRERRSEILVLAEMFIRDEAKRLGHGGVPTLTAEAAALLERHQWPGNVRELRNVAQRAVLLCAHGSVEPQHLRLASGCFSGPASPAVPSPLGEPQATEVEHVNSRNAQASEERLRIIAALRDCGGNQSRAAELLRIPRRTFVAKISAYNIPRPRAQR